MTETPGKKKNILRLLEIPAVLIFLSAILIVVYFPLIGHFDSYVISGEPDGFAYWAWRNWMASGLIDSLAEKGGNPLNLVYYGVLINNTMPESGNILDIIFISYPLRKIFAFPASYNLKILLILLFNGFAGWFVISRLVKNTWIAAVCGTFIMLNPIVFFAIHKARLRDAIIGFIILSLYYLYRAVSTLSLRNAILTGIFLGITSIVYWFYGMFCIWVTLGVIFAVLIQIIMRKNKKLLWRFLKRSALAAIITTVIVTPFAIWYTPFFQKVKLLSDVTLFVPYPQLNEIFAQPEPFTGAGGFPINLSRIILFDSAYSNFFPFCIPFVVLGIFAFFRFRRFQAWFPFIILFFWLYSLGPYLRVSPEVNPESFMVLNGNVVKMPYYYMFQFIPVSGRLHHPVEGLMMVSVSFMFLAGMGMSVLWGWLQKVRLIRGMLITFLIIAVFAHTWILQNIPAVPVYPSINLLAVPSVYKEFGIVEKKGIIELPLDRSADLRCFYKTYHQQKVLLFNPWNMVLLPEKDLPDNQFTWSNRNEFDLKDLPFVRSLERLYSKETESLDTEGLDKLKERGYEYIFLHERDFVRVEEKEQKLELRGKEDYETFKRKLEKQFGEPEIRREFHHCLLSLPELSDRNNYPHYSHEISVFRISHRH